MPKYVGIVGMYEALLPKNFGRKGDASGGVDMAQEPR
jgi:hypothetical protein